jgi:SAM-dependent methyltransferase
VTEGNFEDHNESRFININDESCDNFIFPLPKSWVSRPYEYVWAARFVDKSDVVLDAACGISHPFKFYLCDHAKETFANDIDARLGSRNEMEEEIVRDIGVSHESIPERYFSKIKYDISSITGMPYEDEKFDKIFCISVLEHLRDGANSHPMIPRRLAWAFGRDIYLALKEFRRVLKKNGRIVLTFDHPIINLDYFGEIIGKAGLRYVDGVNVSIGGDALYYPEKELHFFRAILMRDE